MSQQLSKRQIGAGGFESIAWAEQALGELQRAGFTSDHLTVICPGKLKDRLSPSMARRETPAPGAAEVITEGGAVGAVLGGVVLATAALAGLGSGGVALVLIGGGAIAGGFSNLIVSKGYQTQTDDRVKKAVERGWVVISVDVDDDQDADEAATTVERIFREKGAHPLNDAGVGI